jgi:hypothetical protein
LIYLYLAGDGGILAIQLRERRVELLDGFRIVANDLLLTRPELFSDCRITQYRLLLAGPELLNLLLYVCEAVGQLLKPLRTIGGIGGHRG